jgi:DNA-binding transcriptional ArsR family regulator
MNKACKCGPNCTCKNCVCGPYAFFFDTLGNESRFSLLYALRRKAKTVSELIDATGLEQTQVSHALKRLEQGGLVHSTRDGKYRVYAVNKETVEPLLSLIDDHVKKHCAPHAKPCCCTGGKHETKAHHSRHALRRM